MGLAQAESAALSSAHLNVRPDDAVNVNVAGAVVVVAVGSVGVPVRVGAAGFAAASASLTKYPVSATTSAKADAARTPRRPAAFTRRIVVTSLFSWSHASEARAPIDRRAQSSVAYR